MKVAVTVRIRNGRMCMDAYIMKVAVTVRIRNGRIEKK